MIRGISHQLLLYLLFMNLLACRALDPSPPSIASFNCDRERKILTANNGIISSGNRDYPMDSHCEWLIQASNKQSFITLNFYKMDTECSYDHVFLYDGDSYKSPILGSFSGNTTPPSVTTSQGSMLILLYSDTNYVRGGFEAEYFIYPCPRNCTGRGICKEGRCNCPSMWGGPACEDPLCPNNCGGQGRCLRNDPRGPVCECAFGYSGMDCSLPDSNKAGGNTWHLISKSGIGARASHTGTYVAQMDSFYVFGGYTFRRVLGDTHVFSFRENQWTEIVSDVAPSPRHGHAAICYHDNILLFGGELENGALSNELWFFNVTSRQWNLMLPKSHFLPPPLTRHSVTLVDVYYLYVIGGSLQNGTFSPKMYRINVRDMSGWEIVDVFGGGGGRLLGHSAVYHQQSRSILIFGGITAEYSHVSKLTNHLSAFHIDRRYWIKLKYENSVHVPLERAFHTAAIVGEYMVIHGGYTHKHAEEEVCYDNHTYLYHLRCHKWVYLPTLSRDFPGTHNPVKQGIFSHAMGVRRGHTLVLFGGFSGLMRQHLLAYVLPPVILSDISSSCDRHKHMESCLSNLACGWCTDTSVCVERNNNKACSKFAMDTCPGLCPALSDCLACIIWGQSFAENIISDTQDPFPPLPCNWCVQDAQCHHTDDAMSTCSGGTNSSKHHYLLGWWGSGGVVDISTLEDCYTKDFPPGLLSVKFRSPPNYSQPDDVTYLRSASEEVLFRPEILQRGSESMEENVVKLIGLLYPLQNPLRKLSVCYAGCSTQFLLSNDSSNNQMDTVSVNALRLSFSCFEAQRARLPLFPLPVQRYAFELIVRVPAYLNETSVVQLKWSAPTIDSEVVDYRHLELPKSGGCVHNGTCLSCLTDVTCGWCESNSGCYSRNQKNSCQKNGKSSFLITHPENCTVCSDYIYCDQCTQIPTCEWLVETAICVRRGRSRYAVKEPYLCPTPCPLRSSCVSCLGDPGMCAWCEETRTCFLFSTYTSSFAYGKCRDWVDENRSGIGSSIRPELCRNCTRHNQCAMCIRDLACGWCSSPEDPTRGICVDGDFSGPTSGKCFKLLKNSSDETSIHWSYASCPDLEECRWGLHNCHENATCHNTPDSYTCECNLGFEGDGQTCIRACIVKCVHGYCSNSPDYICICDIGWTGEDCSLNCGCNNHSTCLTGIGICDECLNWTQGRNCEKCRPGSYGEAISAEGCHPCDCNGHGDPLHGQCNNTSGECFCLHNTMGSACTECKDGYYGDPKNNGNCFEECHPRRVITNAVEGKFGSPALPRNPCDCLWLITIHSVFDIASLSPPIQKTQDYLQLTIHSDMNIPCPHNHLYVYDGLPNFVATDHPNVLLGTYCGVNLSRPLTTVATSGYMTVHYERDGRIPFGFNASYIRLQQNKTGPSEYECCKDKENCTCATICPNNCSYSLSQGKCNKDYGVCNCGSPYSGEDCSIEADNSYSLFWSLLYSHSKALNNTYLPGGRIGHSLISVKEDLYLFGGYSLASGSPHDLYVYNTTKNRWRKVVLEYSPPPRHFHAGASYNGSMYIFGGLGPDQQDNLDETLLEDFWELTDNLEWKQLPEITISSQSLAIAGSTLTPIPGNKLLLIGGYSPLYGFFEKVMEYDIENKAWIQINCSGAKPIGVYGHSSAYHSDTESVYLFGGVLFEIEKVAASSSLYAFHYPTAVWYRLPPDNKVNKLQTQPRPRYFHTSVIQDNYLLVLGGRGPGLPDDASLPFAYVFSCNLWIPLTDDAIDIIGEWPSQWIGASAALANEKLYLFGGTEGKLIQLQIPEDICSLFSGSRVGCMQQTGCAFCSLHDSGVNVTLCFTQETRAQGKCYTSDNVKLLPSVHCNTEWIEKRNCHQYTTCNDCVASWPAFPMAKQVCQWCSNCRTGRCVPFDASCEEEGDCTRPYRKVVNDTALCPLHLCAASDCPKCATEGPCFWTRQVQRSNGFGHTLTKLPLYPWGCVEKEIQLTPPFLLESSPPDQCPAPCYSHTDCNSCLRSPGADGGWKHCVWSPTLHICMSPTYELLRCENGACGLVLRGENASSCPLACWQHVQAVHCLGHVECGWCAFAGDKVDGRGLCMEGGVMGPKLGSCKENQVTLNNMPLPSETRRWLELSEGSPTWTYLQPPPENECNNDHHSCNHDHEECHDTLEGYECHCKPGYKMEGKLCRPTCSQGCVNGTCVQPDDCQCSFGFVGENCSVACKCNGHSNCPGPNDLVTCIDCKNNTFGSQCEKCKPLFVGNPVNGGSCVSCLAYCHTHTSICLTPGMFNGSMPMSVNQSLIDELLEHVSEGPLEEAECIACQNHTEGSRCERCIDGFFKVGELLEEGCRVCECHGHGDMCDRETGENCNCGNNTENDRQCTQKGNMKGGLPINIPPCWQLQCSKCKEYFLGSPSHSHQCYRHMFLDKEYCFDPATQGECNRIPNPLRKGQTVFFAVQPRYMNVDIRIVVDITKGGLDFFLSAKEDAFIVDVEKPSGLHHIYVDYKYGIDFSHFENIPDLSTVMRRKRGTLDNETVEFNNESNTIDLENLLRPKVGEADGLTTYIHIKKFEDILLIQNLENRLVVTIPQQVHDLRTTRFYMILRSSEPETFGSLFFRQDQTRIDLFVFFSVFFSSFFLFLSMCVVAWKVKQAFDLRRARRLHAAEMKHMASRPFATIITVIEDDPEDGDLIFCSPSQPRKRTKSHLKNHGRDSPKHLEDKVCLRPIAVEAHADGYAAVTTILIQLPGGQDSLMRMCLGSALITAKSSHYHFGYGLRAAMRRRTSHANV